MRSSLKIEATHPLYVGELEASISRIDALIDDWVDKDGKKSEVHAHGINSADFEQEDPNRKPYTIIDGIAVYKISGPLLSNGSWFSRVLGYSAYDDIRSDLMQAAADPDVNEILLYMGTPGGSVFGVTDASDALTKVGAIKPLFVYSAKNVASGGYWLACNAGTLIASPESEWGSVGVIVVHCSYEKQLEEDGIAVTVIKSDELKAVGGPYKDLTDKEVSHIKSQVDQYNDLFHEHVRTKRPGVRLASMRGETYIGAEALRMGLVDAVMNYDQAIDYIKSKRKVTTQTGGYRMKMTAEELKVALEAGATLESLGITEAEAAEIQASAEETNTEATEGKETDVVIPEVGALQEQLLAMTQQVAEKDAEIAALKESLAKVETDTALVADMKSAISDMINNKRIALQLTKLDFSAFSAESLMADYKAITGQFDAAFKTGGLFAKKEEKKQPSVASNSVHARLLDAAA